MREIVVVCDIGMTFKRRPEPVTVGGQYGRSFCRIKAIREGVKSKIHQSNNSRRLAGQNRTICTENIIIVTYVYQVCEMNIKVCLIHKALTRAHEEAAAAVSAADPTLCIPGYNNYY